jgi:hypothetical protein
MTIFICITFYKHLLSLNQMHKTYVDSRTALHRLSSFGKCRQRHSRTSEETVSKGTFENLCFFVWHYPIPVLMCTTKFECSVNGKVGDIHVGYVVKKFCNSFS